MKNPSSAGNIIVGQGQKKWRELNATLVLIDEGGFTLVSPLKRTWAPCGCTPVVQTSLDHHERINLFGALLVSSDGKNIRLSVRAYDHTLSGEQVIEFLKQLLRQIPGEIVLVWDRHPIHKRKAVQKFIKTETRLHVYWFPVSAPELNPAEIIWTQLSEHTASTAPYSIVELRKNIFTGIAKIRRAKFRLQYCLSASGLSWK
jgi:transposase